VLHFCQKSDVSSPRVCILQTRAKDTEENVTKCLNQVIQFDENTCYISKEE
jgi:hypothetical protein